MAAVGVLANFQSAGPKLLWDSEHPHLGCKKFCQGTTRTWGETYRCCLLAREREEIAKVSYGSLETLVNFRSCITSIYQRSCAGKAKKRK